MNYMNIIESISIESFVAIVDPIDGSMFYLYHTSTTSTYDNLQLFFSFFDTYLFARECAGLSILRTIRVCILYFLVQYDFKIKFF